MRLSSQWSPLVIRHAFVCFLISEKVTTTNPSSQCRISVDPPSAEERGSIQRLEGMPFVLSFGDPFAVLILYRMSTVKHHSVVITGMEVLPRVSASF